MSDLTQNLRQKWHLYVTADIICYLTIQHIVSLISVYYPYRKAFQRRMQWRRCSPSKVWTCCSTRRTWEAKLAWLREQKKSAVPKQLVLLRVGSKRSFRQSLHTQHTASWAVMCYKWCLAMRHRGQYVRIVGKQSQRMSDTGGGCHAAGYAANAIVIPLKTWPLQTSRHGQHFGA